VPIQLVLLPPIWNALIFEDVATLPVFGCTVRVLSWQALVLLKLYAGGLQNLLDARQIVAVQQPTRADRQAVAALAETVGLSEAWHALVDR